MNINEYRNTISTAWFKKKLFRGAVALEKWTFSIQGAYCFKNRKTAEFTQQSVGYITVIFFWASLIDMIKMKFETHGPFLSMTPEFNREWPDYMS